MLVGAMNNPGNKLLDELCLFGELSFDFVEVTIEAENATPEIIRKQKKRINDIISSYNFGVLGHLPWYFHVAHPYPAILKAYEKESIKAMDAACVLKAEKVTIHTEFLPTIMDRKALVEGTIKTMGRMKREADDRGILLCVENMDGASFTIDEFRRLVDGVGVKLTFDIGHANIGGGIGAFVKEFKSDISHVHAHDNFGKDDLHLPIGAGGIDWKKVVKTLRGFYDDTVTIETHSQDRDYLRASREKFEIIWYGERKAKKLYDYPEIA
jgi:sugar phosphate isomerase/epimerase